MSRTLRLAALISGGGRTLLNLADRIEAGELAAAIPLVIASRANASGVERARRRGLTVRIADHAAFPEEAARHDAIDAWLDEAGVDLVCLCGYLKWFRVAESRRHAVMNIHPALLPDFGGCGMYGLKVHRAVLETRPADTGCTVHFVDEQYDHGPTILQRRCPVQEGDDEQTLADRVFAEECEAYPEAIRLFAEGRLEVDGGKVRIPGKGTSE